jgi:hypothetical protein
MPWGDRFVPNPNRQAAFADLRDQLARAAVKPASILGGAAGRAAEALRSAVPDPAADLEAAGALGLYHWLRYQALSRRRGQADLAMAAQYFEPVYAVAPGAVPEPLHGIFEGRVPAGLGLGAAFAVMRRPVRS